MSSIVKMEEIKPILEHPESILRPEITVNNISVYGFSIGKKIIANLPEEIIDDIDMSKIGCDVSINEQYEKVKNSQGCLYFKNDVSVIIEKGIVNEINFAAKFWKNAFVLNNDQFRKYFGEPDFEFDNYLTADYYIPKENIYCYKEKGIEISEMAESKEITKISFKKIKFI